MAKATIGERRRFGDKIGEWDGARWIEVVPEEVEQGPSNTPASILGAAFLGGKQPTGEARRQFEEGGESGAKTAAELAVLGAVPGAVGAMGRVGRAVMSPLGMGTARTAVGLARGESPGRAALGGAEIGLEVAGGGLAARKLAPIIARAIPGVSGRVARSLAAKLGVEVGGAKAAAAAPRAMPVGAPAAAGGTTAAGASVPRYPIAPDRAARQAAGAAQDLEAQLRASIEAKAASSPRAAEIAARARTATGARVPVTPEGVLRDVTTWHGKNHWSRWQIKDALEAKYGPVAAGEGPGWGAVVDQILTGIGAR